MRYFVHGSDGAKYGPADLELLTEWKLDGRIAPETVIEPEVGGPTVPAKSIAELFPEAQERQMYGQTDWGYEQEPQQPVRDEAAQGTAMARLGWILSVLSLVACPAVFSAGAVVLAYLAKKRGYPYSTALMAFALVCGTIGYVMAVVSLFQFLKQRGII